LAIYQSITVLPFQDLMENKEANRELLRALRLKDAVAIGLGAIIGAGIFVVTGVAAGISGPAFLVGLIIAGTVATFNGISSAQLAAVYPQSGGTYEYGYRLLNPTLGFSAGWMFLLSKLSAAGVVAMGFGSYFYQLLPVVSPIILSIMAIVILTAANYFGIKKTGMLNMVIVAITLLSLLYLVFSGIPEIRMENFQPFAPFGISGIAESSALLFFAFTGYARIATLAEEVVEPEKTIPRAVIITILSAIVLYAAVSVVAIGVIGSEGMAGSISPLQEVAAALHAPAILTIITIGAATAMLGVLLSQILGISRMMFAMGRKKDLMPVLQSVHKQYSVPHVGIILTGSIILILTLFGSFDFILRAASFTILLYYSITNIAALRQPVHQQLYGKVVPVLGLIGCVLMAFSLPIMVIFSGFGLLLVGFGARWLIRRLI
jgi:basic amino acid/polyamine antiporter, APA family